VNRDGVMRWVAAYERAWRDTDLPAVSTLFSETAAYRRSPYENPLTGHAEIRQCWPADDGRTFTMTAQPVAVGAATRWSAWRCATATR
jgi:hypothetical protein